MTEECLAIELMQVLHVAVAGAVHPFGDERTVFQAFPSGVPAEITDPFLMCDDYKLPSDEKAQHPDNFPIGWHPHRGFDILSYVKSGVGRHADSLGNRETFETPGLQWISCGSGIEHAEGGGNEKGVVSDGFQQVVRRSTFHSVRTCPHTRIAVTPQRPTPRRIWINVPTSRKMDPPRYGTEGPDRIPQIELSPAATARLLAGELRERRGPFRPSSTDLEIIDFEIEAEGEALHEIREGLDSAILYVYEGEGWVSGRRVAAKDVLVLDATVSAVRGLHLFAPTGMSALLFAGRKLKQPIAWHGPIVMSSQAELRQAFAELREGRFPPTRVPWDYKRASARPKL